MNIKDTTANGQRPTANGQRPTANGQRPTANALYHEWIDYYNQMLVGQIEPELDIAWQERLAKIFAAMPEKWCVRIDSELLRHKGITWERASGRFLYKPRPNDLKEFAGRNCHPKLRPFAEWCGSAVEQIEGMGAALAIADLLENTIEKINSIDVGSDVDMLISRHALQEKFIYAAGAAVKKKQRLKMPASRRSVDSDMVKSFINEVFLKQQLLDYRFHITRRRQLQRMQHPVLNTYLSREQGVRRLEIVRTTQYIFALATSHESDVNIFSARRFVNEENILNYIYYNGVGIREDALDDAASVDDFKQNIQHHQHRQPSQPGHY